MWPFLDVLADVATIAAFIGGAITSVVAFLRHPRKRITEDTTKKK